MGEGLVEFCVEELGRLMMTAGMGLGKERRGVGDDDVEWYEVMSMDLQVRSGKSVYVWRNWTVKYVKRKSTKFKPKSFSTSAFKIISIRLYKIQVPRHN